MIARYEFSGSGYGEKEFQDAACAWLEANGITPASVPVRGRFVIADGVLTYEEWSTDRRARIWRTVPLLAPMPPELEERSDWRLPPHLCDRCQTDLEETG